MWRMATASVDELAHRAEAVSPGPRWAITECESVMGGGTLPDVTIPSAGLAAIGDVTGALRSCATPVVAHLVDGSTVCDMRTVFPEQDEQLARALKGVSGS